MAYKIKINKEKCIGCGACAAICDKTFEMHGEKAAVKKSIVKDLSCESEAADCCPSKAITISK